MDIFEHYSVSELQGLEVLNCTGTSVSDATRLWVPGESVTPQTAALRLSNRTASVAQAAKSDPEPTAPARPAATVARRPSPTKVTRNLWTSAHRRSPKPAAKQTPGKRLAMTSTQGRTRRRTPRDERLPILQLPESRSLLADILGGIRTTFDNGTTQTRLLYRDAVAVRAAVLASTDPSHLVTSFARRTLNIKGVTEHVVNAVIDVLLAEDWPSSSLPDDQLRALLLTRTRERHRAHRPLLESRMHRMTIASLSADVITPAGHTSLEQLIPGTTDTEAQALAVGMWEDKRLRSMVDRLTDDGRAIIEMFARFPGLSWAQAAELAGWDARRGEQLRRQLRYLAREINRRENMLSPRAGTPSTR